MKYNNISLPTKSEFVARKTVENSAYIFSVLEKMTEDGTTLQDDSIVWDT